MSPLSTHMPLLIEDVWEALSPWLVFGLPFSKIGVEAHGKQALYYYRWETICNVIRAETAQACKFYSFMQFVPWWSISKWLALEQRGLLSIWSVIAIGVRKSYVSIWNKGKVLLKSGGICLEVGGHCGHFVVAWPTYSETLQSMLNKKIPAILWDIIFLAHKWLVGLVRSSIRRSWYMDVVQNLKEANSIMERTLIRDFFFNGGHILEQRGLKIRRHNSQS